MSQAWPTKRLADVCQILGGATPSKKNAKFYGGDIPWATVGDMNVEVITATEEYITKVAVADCSTNVIPSGSIVMATRVGLGKVCVLGQDTAINQDLKGLTPKNPKELTNRWLYWWLKSKASDIQKAGTGATVQGVKMTFVQELEIPLPPLAEQKRIVGLLDEAFAGIDEGKAKAEANQQKATAVFESHLQSLFAIDSPNWARAKLSSLTTKIGSGATPRGGEESYKDEGVSLIRSLNVHDYGFKYAKLAFLDAVQAEELSGVTVQENDVLLNITGASVARCTIVPRGVLPARVNQHVAIIRPMPEKVCSAFLHYLLISQPYKSRLLETGEEGGSTRQAITKAQLLEFTISHPVSVETQQAIAKHLDEIREQTRRLSQLHKQRLDALTALKQSILSQAFAGELTT
jgi:type I restriction enzyme, S subunit